MSAPWEVETGLQLIFFVGFALFFVLGSRFGWYAYKNGVASRIESEEVIWLYLIFVGVTSAGYGAAAGAGVALGLGVPIRDGILLGQTLLLALVLREIQLNDALSNSEKERMEGEGSRVRRALEMTFVILTLTSLIGGGFIGDSPTLKATEAFSSLVFVVYGTHFARQYLQNPLNTGTGMDTLLRHLLPLLFFSGMVTASDAMTGLGFAAEIAAQVQAAFLLIASSSMMMATIKLRQNLAGM